MSLEINPATLPIQTTFLPKVSSSGFALQNSTAQAEAGTTSESTPREPAKYLRSALQKLSAGTNYREGKTFKDFSKLSHTLEQVFSEAEKVDRTEGESELKQGGLRRIDTDLRKLFKGLGLPSQLAKEFSRGITAELRDGETELVSFSLSSSRSFDLSLQQEQLGYLATGDGNGIVAGSSSSFQLSSVQTQSVDISINLRTGEFSLNRSSSESLTISTSSSAALASITPAAEQSTGASAEQTDTAEAEPLVIATTASPNEVSALFASDSSLLQISRTVQQSAIMRLPQTKAGGETSEVGEVPFSAALTSLQQLVDKLGDLSGAMENVFDSLTAVNNLRVERNPTDGDNYLNFSLAAQAPIGLTAVDEAGRSNTVYPRPDGSIGNISEAAVSVTA